MLIANTTLQPQLPRRGNTLQLTWSVGASCDASSGDDAYASSSTSSASWLWTSSMGWICGHQHHTGEAPGAGGLLLDVVVLKSAAILELLAREDKTLLVGGDALL